MTIWRKKVSFSGLGSFSMGANSFEAAFETWISEILIKELVSGVLYPFHTHNLRQQLERKAGFTKEGPDTQLKMWSEAVSKLVMWDLCSLSWVDLIDSSVYVCWGDFCHVFFTAIKGANSQIWPKRTLAYLVAKEWSNQKAEMSIILASCYASLFFCIFWPSICHVKFRYVKSWIIIIV